jgi:hypothetical protein
MKKSGQSPTMASNEDERSSPLLPPPPPPVPRPNIEERISMIQMAMLHHQGRYQLALSNQGAIALVLPSLPQNVAIAQPSSSTSSKSSFSALPNPNARRQNSLNRHIHPQKHGMLRRLASSLGCRGKKKKTKHGYQHAPPVDDIVTVRRLSESEW